MKAPIPKIANSAWVKQELLRQYLLLFRTSEFGWLDIGSMADCSKARFSSWTRMLLLSMAAWSVSALIFSLRVTISTKADLMSLHSNGSTDLGETRKVWNLIQGPCILVWFWLKWWMGLVEMTVHGGLVLVKMVNGLGRNNYTFYQM